MSVPLEKYKAIKRKLREVLEENEFLASKLWKFKTRMLQLEKERDVLAFKVRKAINPAADPDCISDSDDSISAVNPPVQSSATVTSTPIAPTSNGPSIKKEGKDGKEGKESRKRRPVVSKTIRIQKYDMDDSGRPILPLTTGVMTIVALGEVVFDRPAYHTERYIYPVGFKSVRSFMSILDPEKVVNYTCEVQDGGDAPKFVVTPEDCPDKAISAISLTGAWSPFFKAAYALRNKDHSSGLSGPEYFGFSQGIVIKCIQELPNANLCKNYVPQQFEFIQARKRAGKQEDSAKKMKTGSSVSLEANIAPATGSTETISSDIAAPLSSSERRLSKYDDDDLDGDDEDDDMDADDLPPTVESTRQEPTTSSIPNQSISSHTAPAPSHQQTQMFAHQSQQGNQPNPSSAGISFIPTMNFNQTPFFSQHHPISNPSSYQNFRDLDPSQFLQFNMSPAIGSTPINMGTNSPTNMNLGSPTTMNMGNDPKQGNKGQQ